MTTHKQVVNALMRQDFHYFFQKAFEIAVQGKAFLPNWHLKLLAWKLQQVAEGEIRRLIINLPPRSGKSTLGSVAFPAWLAGLNPTIKLICVSYAEGLAFKHSLDCRRVMESPDFSQAFPDFDFAEQPNDKRQITSTMGGYRYATSVGGTLTGNGGDGIIIDDPLNTSEVNSAAERNKVIDFYKQTLASRLDEMGEGFIVVIAQRTHVEDLPGFLMEHGDWEVINLAAIAEQDETVQIGPDAWYTRKKGEALHPARQSVPQLLEMKALIGSYAFAAQYQQQPVPPEGHVVKDQWLQVYDPAKLPAFQMIAQSWDTGAVVGEGNSYSVCTTWGMVENRYYLLDVLREQLSFTDLKKAAFAMAAKWKPNAVLIEHASTGIPLIDQVKSKMFVITGKPDKDKVTRLESVTPVLEAGRVFLPADAPWLADYKKELLAFPHGKHDDQVDATTQFLYWILKKYDLGGGGVVVTVKGGGGGSGGAVVDHYYRRMGIPTFPTGW